MFWAWLSLPPIGSLIFIGIIFCAGKSVVLSDICPHMRFTTGLFVTIAGRLEQNAEAWQQNAFRREQKTKTAKLNARRREQVTVFFRAAYVNRTSLSFCTGGRALRFFLACADFKPAALPRILKIPFSYQAANRRSHIRQD